MRAGRRQEYSKCGGASKLGSQANARTFPALAAYSNIALRSKEQQEDGKR